MQRFDVAIVGAGYSGAVLSWILASQGRSVLLVDRGQHPRFAIGESSTPLADLILDRLAERYSLAPLASLARYGRWKRDLPQLICGPKRGFSYFRHQPHQSFHDNDAHENSLLVAASPTQESSDTHWLRSDVDQFLTASAVSSGVDYRGQTRVQGLRHHGAWQLELSTTHGVTDSRWQASADFLVDASGAGKFAEAFLPVRNASARLRTRTRATYGHFVGVASWSQELQQRGYLTEHEPFDADDAAQHHLLDDGWLWMLRFDDGRTSVGRVVNTASRIKRATAPLQPAAGSTIVSALELDPYPSLSNLMAGARQIAPPAGLVRSGRLQQAWEPVAGPHWAMLPTAAATIDPWHSTGIAHGLAGVQQLSEILLEDSSQRAARLAEYAATTLREIRFIDTLVSTSYASMGCFRRLATSTMLYFIAAIDCEERYAAGQSPRALWSIDRADLMAAIDDCVTWLNRSEHSPQQVEELVRKRLSPWNQAGLLDASVRNRYRYTAAQK